jgi:hypothetical protein
MSLHYTAIFAFGGTIATVLSLLFKRSKARRFASTLEGRGDGSVHIHERVAGHRIASDFLPE